MTSISCHLSSSTVPLPDAFLAWMTIKMHFYYASFYLCNTIWDYLQETTWQQVNRNDLMSWVFVIEAAEITMDKWFIEIWQLQGRGIGMYNRSLAWEVKSQRGHVGKVRATSTNHQAVDTSWNMPILSVGHVLWRIIQPRIQKEGKLVTINRDKSQMVAEWEF